MSRTSAAAAAADFLDYTTVGRIYKLDVDGCDSWLSITRRANLRQVRSRLADGPGNILVGEY